MEESTWIEDGTKTAEPVTTETPEATATETSEAVEVVAGETTDEHGKWVAAETAEAVEATPETTEAVQAETAEEAVRKFIEGKLGEEAFQLPEDVLLPLKRGKDIDYRPLKEVLADGLRLNDYSRNMNSLKERERAFESREAEGARQERIVAEKEKYLAEREAEIKAALSNPESAAAYEQHLRMLETNPMYRKAFERDWTARETEVQLAELQEDRDRRLVQEASTQALGWIETLAAEFPGVDPGRVASIYGQSLSSGKASLSQDEVRSIYRSEADYIASATKPLQDQLAELVAKIDLLSESKAAEKHNEATQHAVKRAKATPVATGRGAPTTVPVKPTKFAPNELADRNQAWIDGA